MEEYQRNYDLKSDDQIRLDFNWAFNMHLARIVAMLMLAFFIRAGLVIVLVLALSYIEIYPLRTLRILGGEGYIDPKNESRSRD